MGRTVLVTDRVTSADNSNKNINPYLLYPLEFTGRLPVSAYLKIPASPAASVI